MAQLIVRNLEENVKAKLKRRAELHGCSMEAEIREIVQRTLEKEGWEVVQAKDGVDGLEQLAKHQPEVILLDLMMPRMDGFQFVAE